MAKQVTATAAKNNFGGLIEDVLEHGRVDIVRHGRVVAVMVAPRVAAALPSSPALPGPGAQTHMIPPARARAARVVSPPRSFDED